VRKREKKKKMLEMVNNQTINQAANPLKKGKKKNLKLKKKRKEITSSGTVELQS
jgi:hypothetical protein